MCPLERAQADVAFLHGSRVTRLKRHTLPRPSASILPEWLPDSGPPVASAVAFRRQFPILLHQ